MGRGGAFIDHNFELTCLKPIGWQDDGTQPAFLRWRNEGRTSTHYNPGVSDFLTMGCRKPVAQYSECQGCGDNQFQEFESRNCSTGLPEDCTFDEDWYFDDLLQPCSPLGGNENGAPRATAEGFAMLAIALAAYEIAK